MRFTGPKNGKLEIAAGQNLCLILAANILGLEPDEEMASTYADDALREALNVLCGRFLTEAFGEEAVFNLSAPVIGSLNDISHVDELAESECMQYFETEEHCLVVKLTMYKPTAVV
jgi:chemotaxis protein CheY-P-specific phosphatase CheC